MIIRKYFHALNVIVKKLKVPTKFDVFRQVLSQILFWARSLIESTLVGEAFKQKAISMNEDED